MALDLARFTRLLRGAGPRRPVEPHPASPSSASPLTGRRRTTLLHDWRLMAVGGVVASLLALGGCARSFVPQRPVPLAVDHAADNETTYMQWLGVSSWVMSRGHEVVVLDPFFSRPTLLNMAFSLLRLTPHFDRKPERIEDVLPALPPGTTFVLIGHAHYDHLMDIPYYLMHPSGRGVTYVGSRTARAILRSFQPPEMDFAVPDADPAVPIVRGHIAVRGFASDHAPHILGIEFMHIDGDLEAQPTPPTRAGQYVDGITQLYLVDFLDAGNAVAFRILATGAANTPEGARALAAARAVVGQESTDVAILCVPGWDQVRGYPESVLGELRHRDANGQWQKGPRHVVLSHYDNFFAPYRNGEDPNGEMDFVIRANYAGLRDKLLMLKSESGYRFELHEPRTGECLAFPANSARLPCQR